MDYMASPLDFYTVDSGYVDYLQGVETRKRGFSRVPNMRYSPEQKKKFVCGIVLKIDKNLYCVPMSSYKKQQADNFLVLTPKGKVVASLRFNYMFPVRSSQLSVRSIASETDEKYKRLLQEERNFCIENEDAIRAQAAKTYQRVINGYGVGLVQNSCDFLLLEQACDLFQARLDLEKKKNLLAQKKAEIEADERAVAREQAILEEHVSKNADKKTIEKQQEKVARKKAQVEQHKEALQLREEALIAEERDLEKRQKMIEEPTMPSEESQTSDNAKEESEATNHGDGFTSLPMPHETEQNESDASTAVTQQDEEIAQADNAQREVPPSAQSEPTQTSGSASLWQMVANMPPQPAAPTSGSQSSNSNNGPVSE